MNLSSEAPGARWTTLSCEGTFQEDFFSRPFARRPSQEVSMPSVGPSTTSSPDSPAPALAIAGTFTVDPIVEPLTLLLREAGLGLSVELAPYGQVFQELLDPGSSLASNRNGINALLLRFEDWLQVPGERTGALDTV